MHRIVRQGALAAWAVAASACATTTFTSTWKAPEAAPLNFAGKKVAALVLSKDQSVRLGAEESLAREITAQGAVGVPAYTLIPAELTRDKEKAKEFLDKAGVAGVVAMRAVAQEKEVSASGGYWVSPGYSSFWGPGYYGYGWGGVYDPGYLRTDTIVSVETLIYSLTQDKLVWAGMSKTTNPSDVPKFIRELAKGAAGELRKQKLIK